jgi:polar amino acid transport system substrate-binding protein
MKMTKSILTLILALVLLLTAAGCTGVTTTTTTTDAELIKIGALADLKDKVIGVQLGTVGDDVASKDTGAKTVERFDQYVDAITALKQKKIDCIVMDKDTADAYVKANSDLVVLDVGFEAEQYAMAVKKGNSELKKVIDEVIAEMRADGSLAQSFIDHEDMQGKAPDYNKGASGGKFVVGTESGFPPYEYPSGNNIIGIDVDIMARVAKKLNKELVMEDMAFDGLIAALVSGKVDAVAAGLTINEERKVNVDYSIHYVDASQVVVLRKTSLK